MIPVDVRGSREITAVVLGMKRAERQVRLDINREARKKMKPVWVDAVRANVTNRIEARVILPGARVKVGARNVTVVAAASNKPLEGGLIPSEDWPSAELGARRRKHTFTTTSRKGKRYRVTRTEGANFKPRAKRGRVAFAAASESGHRIIAYWLEVAVDEFRKAFERKN